MFQPAARLRYECLACGHTITPNQLNLSMKSLLPRDMLNAGVLLDVEGNPWTKRRILLRRLKWKLQEIREEIDFMSVA